MDIENKGNILVRPEGEFSVRDEGGNVVYTAPVEMGSVYAGLTSPLVLVPSVTIPDGEYEISLSLTDKATGASASSENQRIAVSNAERLLTDFAIETRVDPLPEESALVYLQVTALITNNGDGINASDIVLDVLRDGELIQSFR